MIHVKHLKRKKKFVFSDFLSVFISIYLSAVIRTKIDLPFFRGLLPNYFIESNSDFFLMVFILGSIFSISCYLNGIYDLWSTSNTVIWVQRLFIPNLLLVTMIFAYLYIQQKFNFPRSYLITFFIINLFTSVCWRIIYFKFSNKESSKVIIIGDEAQSIILSNEFKKEPFLNKVKVSAIFTTNKSTEEYSNIPIIELNKFEEFSKNSPYTTVIIANSGQRQENIFNEVFKAARRGVPVFTVPSHYEILLGRLKHIQVNDLPLLELKIDYSFSIYVILKRLFETIFASLLLLILFLPLCLVAILVKITSKGPIIYTQERIGLDGKSFKIIKFRSMILNAESSTGAIIAQKNDPRITRFGNFIRKSRIDEIPQLINIIFGDMSFIGPRPERKIFVEKFQKEIPVYSERTRIRPGITGLAQVNGEYDSSPETKLKYDLAYLVNQGLILDLQIIFKTIKTILVRSGR